VQQGPLRRNTLELAPANGLCGAEVASPLPANLGETETETETCNRFSISNGDYTIY
jgi:hypothetical protein